MDVDPTVSRHEIGMLTNPNLRIAFVSSSTKYCQGHLVPMALYPNVPKPTSGVKDTRKE